MSTNDEFRLLINQEANALLGGQVSLSSAADARATALLAAGVTLAGIAFGALAALYKDESLGMLLGGCWGTGIIALTSAAAAVWAAWPATVTLPGWAPVDFEADIGRPLSDILEEMLSENQVKISSNRLVIETAYRRCLLSLGLLVAAPFSGLAGAIMTINFVGMAVALLIWGLIVAGLLVFFVPQVGRAS